MIIPQKEKSWLTDKTSLPNLQQALSLALWARGGEILVPLLPRGEGVRG
jgi:hypothetical protein